MKTWEPSKHYRILILQNKFQTNQTTQFDTERHLKVKAAEHKWKTMARITTHLYGTQGPKQERNF